MINLVTKYRIPVFEVVSATTVDNSGECCPVTSACLPDGVALPRTLYIQFFDSDDNHAWSGAGCPASDCRGYFSFSRALTWNAGTDSWELEDGDVTDTADTDGCAVLVSLSLKTTGPEEANSLDCFLKLTGTLRAGATADPIDNAAGSPADGATLDTGASTFDPLYLVFTADNDTCAGKYIITE